MIELKNKYAKELRTLVANELGPKIPPRYLSEVVLDFMEPIIQEIAALKAASSTNATPMPPTVYNYCSAVIAGSEQQCWKVVCNESVTIFYCEHDAKNAAHLANIAYKQGWDNAMRRFKDIKEAVSTAAQQTQQTGTVIEHNLKLFLQDGTTLDLVVHLCDDKEEVQRVVKSHLGYLPSNCTDCFWMEHAAINIAIRKTASIGRIAHEAFHATSEVAKARGLDPNNYELIRPMNDDFGYIPAEVCADLCEQITNILSAKTLTCSPA